MVGAEQLVGVRGATSRGWFFLAGVAGSVVAGSGAPNAAMSEDQLVVSISAEARFVKHQLRCKRSAHLQIWLWLLRARLIILIIQSAVGCNDPCNLSLSSLV